MKYASFYVSCLTLALTACANNPEKIESTPLSSDSATPKTYLNEYPTRDRVEYVLNCVAQHGGLTYVTQYACGCKLDKIAEKIAFSDFEAAKTFGYLKSLPGENGSAFRDPQQSKTLRKLLKTTEEDAEKHCFVK